FTLSDVPIARRIADHITLAVSHEQLATAAKSFAEAHARAERLESRVNARVSEVWRQPGRGRVVGHSESWLDVLKKATQVASTETTVLLSGASGTGTEVVARFIHRSSSRKGGPFVALNCASLPNSYSSRSSSGTSAARSRARSREPSGNKYSMSSGVVGVNRIVPIAVDAVQDAQRRPERRSPPRRWDSARDRAPSECGVLTGCASRR